MKTQNRKTGDFGEEIAVKFLMKHGFTIIERNYSKKWGEIDIVCKTTGLVHFVEVKTLVTDFSVIHETYDSFRPEDNMHEQKIRRLHRAIFSYLQEKDIEEDWQLDLVSVLISNDYKRTKVSLMQNIVV